MATDTSATRIERVTTIPGWLGVRGLRTQAEVERATSLIVRRVSRLAEIPRLFLEVSPTEPIDLRNRLGFQCPWGCGRIGDTLTCSNCEWCGGEPIYVRLVIVSGGSDPVHPQWIRDIRDQCQAAGVAFGFRGYGEWCLIDDAEPEMLDGLDDVAETLMLPDGWRDDTIDKAECIAGGPLPTLFYRVGSARSGALLDGVTWPVPEGF